MNAPADKTTMRERTLTAVREAADALVAALRAGDVGALTMSATVRNPTTGAMEIVAIAINGNIMTDPDPEELAALAHNVLSMCEQIRQHQLDRADTHPNPTVH